VPDAAPVPGGLEVCGIWFRLLFGARLYREMISFWELRISISRFSVDSGIPSEWSGCDASSAMDEEVGSS